MKKRIRLIIIITVVVLLAVVWIWRYVTMNKYYDDLDNGDYKLYQARELVPFEDDGNDLYTDLNGYYIRVDGYEIQDYDAYLENVDFTVAHDENDPDKIALVYVTLVNESCEDSGITLTDFKLHGVDSCMNMNWDILTAANSILEGNTGIMLATGSECQLVLPFDLEEEFFSGSTWRNIDAYELYLQITSSLTTKEILINE